MTHKGLIKNGIPHLGMTDTAKRTIYINNILYGEQLYKVLCHEIVHAFMFSYNLYLDEQGEEKLANFIAEYGKDIIDDTDYILQELCYGFKMC